ncbi:hypothetical protein BpHYR1_051338 [Brachionus plicatilis]|uniref:Uncharacterized protein n=1 Tax=Brachionus plicatilis TaxID=10195 RepID=A0A3M7Q0M6_BRAPC|nr:hypothetical protein BpHYR1_051338 [Brachionus plicatilis]
MTRQIIYMTIYDKLYDKSSLFKLKNLNYLNTGQVSEHCEVLFKKFKKKYNVTKSSAKRREYSLFYPTVLVHESFLVQTQMLIDAEKSKKDVYKSMVTSMIPDVELWGNSNGELMRMNHGKILNASRVNPRYNELIGRKIRHSLYRNSHIK